MSIYDTPDENYTITNAFTGEIVAQGIPAKPTECHGQDDLMSRYVETPPTPKNPWDHKDLMALKRKVISLMHDCSISRDAIERASNGDDAAIGTLDLIFTEFELRVERCRDAIGSAEKTDSKTILNLLKGCDTLPQKKDEKKGLLAISRK